jgi:hypothetical protein
MCLLLFFGLLTFGCSAAQEGSPQDGEPKAERGAFKQVARNEGAAGNAPGEAADKKPTPRKIIYTGVVDLIVDDFDAAETQLRQSVEEHKGYLSNSEIHNQPGSPRSGTWTVRVPTKQFEPFVQAVAKLGEVRNRNTNSQDITDAYHDQAARLKADEAEEQSLLELIKKPQEKIEDVMRVREQLRIVRNQIETSKSQLQRWDKDVDFSTVTVKLLDRRDYTPPLVPDFGSTVGRTFQGSVNALAAFGRGIVLTVVALAPWLAVLAVLGAPGFVVWRRRRAALAQAQRAISIEETSPSAESDRPGGETP